MKPNNLSKNRERERSREKKKSVFICVNDCMCVILYMLVRTQNSYRQIDTDRQTDSSQTDRQK